MNTYVRKLYRGVRYGPRILLGGGVPEPTAQWEREYRSGFWDRLGAMEQLPRYGVIAGYCRSLAPRGRILDVGCGEALLLDHLAPAFSSFTGLDCSESALRAARAKGLPDTRFLETDVEAPEGLDGEAFDVVVFNEVVYYFRAPIETLRRYEALLAPGGAFVVSIFHKLRHVPLERRLERAYERRAEVVLDSGESRWTVRVLQPRRA